ncbi:MAG: InlB B-repeat-containing protein, partial [Clostridiales bacterium]|nr:InlB B-repeat-containing protein [Clostridiales bacterium]
GTVTPAAAAVNNIGLTVTFEHPTATGVTATRTFLVNVPAADIPSNAAEIVTLNWVIGAVTGENPVNTISLANLEGAGTAQAPYLVPVVLPLGTSETAAVVLRGTVSAEASAAPNVVHADGHIVNLVAGEGSVDITVTAEDGTTTAVYRVSFTISTVPQFLVTFNPHDGVFTVPSEATRLVNENAEVGTLPVVTRAGHRFLGWFTADTAGTEVTPTTTITAVVTFHAQWIQQHVVTFNPSGGALANPEEATRNVDHNVAVGALPTVTRTGYNFDGWFTLAEGGVAVTAATVITAPIAFFAQWTAQRPVNVTVSGVVTVPGDIATTITFTYGSTVVGPVNVAASTGAFTATIPVGPAERTWAVTTSFDAGVNYHASIAPNTLVVDAVNITDANFTITSVGLPSENDVLGGIGDDADLGVSSEGDNHFFVGDDLVAGDAPTVADLVYTLTQDPTGAELNEGLITITDHNDAPVALDAGYTLGTGWTVTIQTSDGPLEIVVVVENDIDGDGELDNADLLRLVQYLVRPVGFDLSPAQEQVVSLAAPGGTALNALINLLYIYEDSYA